MPQPILRALLAFTLLALGPASVASAQGQAGGNPSATRQAVHALNRLGYGPGPGQVAAVLAQGPQAWARQQVGPAPFRAPTGPLLPALERLPTLRLDSVGAWEAYRSKAQGQPPNQAFGRQALNEARLARLMACVFAERPLEERLVVAFNNHLHVASGKAGSQALLHAYASEAIRPHLWGRYRDMLGASAKHPAMLRYLDNFQNVAPGRGRRGLNENYARELLELHSLGVQGGYTQGDVEELAKALTGWGLNGARFAFRPRQHLEGTRRLLGQSYPQRGQAQAEAMLDALAMHPATAKRLALMLAQRFVADAPPPALVAALANSYLASGGQLAPMVMTLVEHPAFWAPEAQGAKVKDPLDLVASALRLVGPEALGLLPGASGASAQAEEGATDPLKGPLAAWRLPLRALNRLGGQPWAHAAPDGDPFLNAAWLGPELAARRAEWAFSLASNRTGLDAEAMMRAQGGLPEAQARVVRQAPPRLRAALVLASPSFQRR